jgi:hypothetical protein
MHDLSWVDARQIAVHATLDPRTVMGVYDGKPCTDGTRHRVRVAALALGLPLPIAADARLERGQRRLELAPAHDGIREPILDSLAAKK